MSRVLHQSEYDASYFDGDSQPLRHNAGYAAFQRWHRFDGPNSSGEFWRDVAARFTSRFSLVGKSTLEIGCAKGFLVEDMRDLGVNAFGIEVSEYAVSHASRLAMPSITRGDILQTEYESNSFDFIFSTNFFECVSDATAETLIKRFNRIARFQFHLIGTHTNPQFYNVHTLEEWRGFNWKRGTVLFGNNGEVIK